LADAGAARMVMIEVLIAELRHGDAAKGDAGDLPGDPRARIQQLEKDGKLDSLTRLQLTAVEGQKASLKVGQRVPRITGTTRTPGGQLNSITMENVGLMLGVTPQIRRDGLVVMSIDIERSQPGPAEEGPVISKPADGEAIRAVPMETLTAATTIAAHSGQGVVVGMQETKRQTRQAELVIIVTPTLLGNAQPPAATLPAGLSYTGRVTEKGTGKPIAGATVTVRRQIVAPYEHRIIEEPKCTTDAAGKYTFTIPPEQVAERFMYIELDVSHPNYATRKGFGYALSMIRKNEKLGDRPFFEDVQLYPAEPITGTVVAPDGKPAVGVKVLGFSMPNRSSFDSASFSDSMTDSSGAFRLNLAKGSKAIFWLLPKDRAPSAHVLDEKHGDLGHFTLEKGIAIKGRVVDEQERPVAGVWINAEITGGSAKKTTDLPVADSLVRSALTDKNGEFTLAPLPAGECLVRVAEYPSDNLLGHQSRRAPPGVFGPKRLSLMAGETTVSVVVRAVPQVVIEGQFYDSAGKPRLGHEPMLWGRIDAWGRAEKEQSWMKALSKLWGGTGQEDRGDPGNFYFANGTMDTNGHFIVRAPKGLKEAKLDLSTNEHSALRVRMAKDGPLSNLTRGIGLSTLDHDIRGIEVVRYEAPILLVKVVAEYGTPVEKAKLDIEYGKGRGPREGRGGFVDGRDVHYERQSDGCLRTEQLLPDEEFTVTVSAEGHNSRSENMKLAEGAIRELEFKLQKERETEKAK